MFACANGAQCIEMRYRCDGQVYGLGDCRDGSDEDSCDGNFR